MMTAKATKIEPQVQQLVTTPARLLEIAVDQGADLDRLEKLIELQQRWEETEARKAFIEAMTAFRSSVGNISKNRTGHNTKYADLAHTLESIKNQLSENGLSHTWKTEQGENQLITVTCCVTHRQGHQECTSMCANPDSTGSKNDVQAIGSTTTYLQRYTLYAILGLASTDQDSDGGSPSNPLDENQLANLEALIDEVKANVNAFCKHFQIEQVADLQQSKLKNAIAMLEAKRGGQ